MTRIEPSSPPYAPRVAEDLGKLMPPGMEPLLLFRVLARNPRVLRRIRRGGLLDPGAISVRARELVILRTTARCGAEYEWGVHVAFFAEAAGLSDEAIAHTVRGGPDDFEDLDRIVIRLADALHDRADLDEGLFEEARSAFGDAGVLELLVVAGLYHAVSFVTNATRLPLEESAPRFP